jgi:NitT/TauT family transport system substrate-binding protein
MDSMRLPLRRTLAPLRRTLALLVAGLLVTATAACGQTDASETGPGPTGPAPHLRLGFFANVTHATPLVATKQGFYAKELGSTTLSQQVFNAGPAAVEAVFAGTLDATYIGPNPAINAFVKSKGEAVRIVAGATSGGAALVARAGIDSAQDLKGKTVATPQLGGTQDVALRHWLKEAGLQTSKRGQGDVNITNTENATTLQLFRDGSVDAAWLPEPWASRLVLEAGAKVLVDEKDLWPGGRFVTTHLIVATRFLREHPQTVEALLRGHVKSTAWIAANPEAAKRDVNARLTELAGKPLPRPVIDRAWRNIEVTNDPVATSLQASADHAVGVGLLQPAGLDGIYDLRLLNTVLRAEGKPPADDAGLGEG